ncbi:MAG: adenylate/guanylate cyclase domain-containing protein [Spirochaetes bacterium]|nr:adenylate/guanylate cyclase domain-containing protein [Spirochaetota bacterium]
MKVSRYHGVKFGLLVGPSLAGIVLGAAIAFFFVSKNPTKWTAVQGGLCGLLIGFTAFYMEYFVFDRIRKLTVILSAVLRSIIFSVVIVISYVISDLLVFGAATLAYDVRTFIMPSFGLAMTSILALMLLINISRLLGQKALVRLLVGLYHKPIIRKRIFMFIDLASSTAIAEEIGDIRFHSFLNDFFFDATRPIVECKGEIYKYVGDEIIVSWTMKGGLKDLNCIECFFLIEDAIEALRGRYERQYGAFPRFSAGIHCGDAVIGEMGDYKREVAFLGDVVNTTSRIQSECKARGRRLIISGDLYGELSGASPGSYGFENLGSITLRGKKREVPLYSVTRKASA